ncbi:Gfo/Idh/MocA family oxidoreductase [Dactylosporangium vinaceum]|uniref:Gfo/Idh/MocA family protein n=1 Tax=Dactylosporangium vinaceum TaxID=53362 RepID=A0ABV5MSX5_9ACTN|nr:Gfo/Idh/MocA family oxidoreductase [Dactylosporangium vinaceum]
MPKSTIDPNGPRLRFGVLGCGDIAWRNTVPAIQRCGAEVVAFASRSGDRARRFADRFGGAAVEGYERLLARTDVDAVYVALPTGLHHTWARRALESGRHVLAEKPLTATLDEAADLVRLAAQRGRWLAENFTFPYHSQHTAVQKVIADGEIGLPRVYEIVFGIPARPDGDIRNDPELGGGALLDLGVYTARAIRLMCEPADGAGLEVAGATLSIAPALGVDVAGSALLSLPGGATGHLSFGFGLAYRSAYAVWGSEGRVSLQRAFTPPASLRPVLRLERQDRVEERTLPADDQHANVVAAFVRAAVGGAPFGPQGESLLRQAALVQRIRGTAKPSFA